MRIRNLIVATSIFATAPAIASEPLSAEGAIHILKEKKWRFTCYAAKTSGSGQVRLVTDDNKQKCATEQCAIISARISAGPVYIPKKIYTTIGINVGQGSPGEPLMSRAICGNIFKFAGCFVLDANSKDDMKHLTLNYFDPPEYMKGNIQKDLESLQAGLEKVGEAIFPSPGPKRAQPQDRYCKLSLIP